VPTAAPIVVLDRVTKRFVGHTAVDGLALSVPPGVIFGLLGPNGAGKTTSIRMIMDIIEPDEGAVRLFGESCGGRTQTARIGYLPEERGLYRKMRVLDVLVFLAEMKGVERRAARAKALAWLERLGLADWRLRRIDELSKGMQQKVQFIATLLHEPELVILDEPFAGLDPVNAQVLKDTVLELRRRGVTLLFSTHIMEQAEKLCDQLCIIAQGKKVVDGTLSDIKRTHGGQHLIIGFDGGILLSSGQIDLVIGPNLDDGDSMDWGLPGDPALDGHARAADRAAHLVKVGPRRRDAGRARAAGKCSFSPAEAGQSGD